MLKIKKSKYRLRVVIPAYPAFNIYSSVAKRTTALGPVCIASVVNEMPEWEVEVIDENNLGKFGPRSPLGGTDHRMLQRNFPVDVVGFYGGLTSTIPRLYEIARFYKSQGVVTIAGGQHFLGENIEEALNSHIDYVVMGEAEDTIKELLDALKEGKDMSKIKGIAYKRNGKICITKKRHPPMDLDKYPLPDFSLVRFAKIKLYPVGRIRGCGMDCEFCTVKGKPRYASSKRLFENIRILVERFKAKHFFIVDDLFGQYREDTLRFCNMLEDYQKELAKRLDLTVQIRLDKAKDTRLLSAMRKAGINTVAIGFESPIEEELKAMRKRLKPKEMVELARVYHDFGFWVHGMFIFGYPLKEKVIINLGKEERIKRFRKFIREAKIDTVQVLLPVPLPGTELRKRLKEENRIFSLQDIGWQYYDGNFPIFTPDPPLTAEDLQYSIRRIMSKFYHFRNVFFIGLNILCFPTLLFFFYRIRRGWCSWYRNLRNSFVRFGGWIIIKHWITNFNKDFFTFKLKIAQRHLQ